MNRVQILNSRFDALTFDQTVDDVFSCIKEDQRGWLCTVNVAILMMMRDSTLLQSFVDKAKWIVADGQPLIWVAPLFRGRLPERITGVDLVDAIAKKAAQDKVGIYFLGAKKQIIDTVSDVLLSKYPELNICGCEDGYFNDSEATARADLVRESGAKILFVGMGVPKQERFIEEQWENLGVNVAIGVGGSFDVIAGLRKRAPLLLQKTGMEWAFRLAQEPGRMWKRYLVTNTTFILLIIKSAIKRVFRS